MKTVLITGASRGIGAATAREFSKNGWHVVINYKKSEKEAAALANELHASVVKADVSDLSAVEKMCSEVHSLGIHIDCIINNAGISQECLFSDISENDWDKMFDINVKGAFLVSKAFLPDLFKKKGSIINISSIWGETGAAMEVHYSASKAALIGMTKALAKELAPSGIRVNCICPGYVDTDMNLIYTQDEKNQIISEIPLERIATPEEIAKSIAFFASDSAEYMTGQIIGINGGWYI